MTYYLTPTTKMFGYAGKNYRIGKTYEVSDEVAAHILGKNRRDLVITDEPSDADPVSDSTEADTQPDFTDVDTGEGAQVLHIPTKPFGARPKPEVVEPEPAPEVVPPTPVEKPLFTCDGCGRADFKSKASLTRHFNVNHAPEETA